MSLLKKILAAINGPKKEPKTSPKQNEIEEKFFNPKVRDFLDGKQTLFLQKMLSLI